MAELGIDKRTSSIAQKLAELSEEAFEQVRDGHETVSKAIAAVNQAKTKTKEKVDTVSTPTTEANNDAGSDSKSPKKEATEEENYDPKSDEIKELAHTVAALAAMSQQGRSGHACEGLAILDEAQPR